MEITLKSQYHTVIKVNKINLKYDSFKLLNHRHSLKLTIKRWKALNY